MLTKAEKEIIYGALFITLNFYKFKNYVKINKPTLYDKIYNSHNEQELFLNEDIENIIETNGFGIIREIELAQIELSKTEKKGNIGTLKDYLRTMIIHHNAKNENQLEIPDFELWRPQQKRIS